MSASARDEGGVPAAGGAKDDHPDSDHSDDDEFDDDDFDDDDFDDDGFDDDQGEIDDDEIDQDEIGDNEPRFHDGIPITGYYRGEPIPDLDALPQDQWLEVLRPLSFWPRTNAIGRVSTLERAQAAQEVAGQLVLEDRPPRFEDEPAPPLPAGVPPPRGARHQINFRLGPGEYASLVQAARLFAMRPTALARLLTVRGVNGALYEERRDR